MININFFSLIANSYFQLTFFIILILLNISLLIAYFLMRRKINLFLRGRDAKSLEESIKSLVSETSDLDIKLGKISRKQDRQETILFSAIKKIGIVRFNPFNNIGGDQSFAIAFLNSENSGIVLSSLFLREGTRIYAKPVNNLKSTYSLSKEEEEAIKKAIG